MSRRLSIISLLIGLFTPLLSIAFDDASLDALFDAGSGLESPGFSVAVIKEGDLVYQAGFGSAQLEYAIPITPQTTFHVASVSKQFTTFAVLLLEEDGLLSFDDEVQKHLPWVPHFDHPITLRQLANHTSGVRDQWELLVLAGWRFDDVITMDDIRTMMKHQRELNFPPETEMLYSNMGYSLLAEVVSAVSGMTFEEFTEKRIFQPLEMNSTQFHGDHEEIRPGRAYSYDRDDEGGLRKSVLSYANVGATSLFTTAPDLALWLDNMRTRRLGGETLWQHMLEIPALDSAETSEDDGTGYAGGLAIGTYRGLQTIGHGGSDAGFRSQVLWFPEVNTGIVVLANSAQGDPGGKVAKVADIVLEGSLPEELPDSESAGQPAQGGPVSPAVLQRYEGNFGLDVAGVVGFFSEGGSLYASLGGIGTYALEPVSETEFRLQQFNVTFRFEVEADGSVNRLTAELNGQELPGERLRPAQLAADQAPRYLGRYYSPELRYSMDLLQDADGLFLRHDRHGDIRLSGGDGAELTDLDSELRADRWFVQKINFEVTPGGNVRGLRVSGGRVRNLWFERSGEPAVHGLDPGREPWTLSTAAVPENGPRILLYHDMEGLSGQSDPNSYFFFRPEYAQGQEMLAADINAVVAGLFDGGASEVHIVDGHGSGNPEPDLRSDLLDPRAKQLFRDVPFDAYRDLAEKGAYDAVAVVGMHAKTGSRGFASHTITLGMSVEFNGRTITETELVALSWGRVGVPLIFASGDDRLRADLADRMPWIEFVEVKTARGAGDAVPRPVDEARADLRRQASRAVQRLEQAQVMSLATPVVATLEAVPPASLIMMDGVPGVNYVDNRVTFEAGDFQGAYDGVNALIAVASGASLRAGVAQLNSDGGEPPGTRLVEGIIRVWIEQESSGSAPPQAPADSESAARYHGFR